MNGNIPNLRSFGNSTNISSIRQSMDLREVGNFPIVGKTPEVGKWPRLASPSSSDKEKSPISAEGGRPRVGLRKARQMEIFNYYSKITRREPLTLKKKEA